MFQFAYLISTGGQCDSDVVCINNTHEENSTKTLKLIVTLVTCRWHQKAAVTVEVLPLFRLVFFPPSLSEKLKQCKIK